MFRTKMSLKIENEQLRAKVEQLKDEVKYLNQLISAYKAINEYKMEK